MNVSFRKINFADADMLLEWRNDITTRRNSYNMDLIDTETHYCWMKKVLASDDLFFILQDDSVPVGMVRVALDSDIGTISYNIAPAKRGCGYGKTLIQLLENYILETGMPIRLRASVKKENIASRKIFLRQGFWETGNAEYYIYEKSLMVHNDIARDLDDNR